MSVLNGNGTGTINLTGFTLPSRIVSFSLVNRDASSITISVYIVHEKQSNLAIAITPVTITLAPGYQSSETHIVLAEDLYEETAEGDEPEPLEIVQHKLSDLEKLTYQEDLTEARSILALYMTREIILSRKI